MTSIDTSLYLSNQPKPTTNNGDYLGKDAFLKLLITQLQNQDPTNPMQDKEFIAQMAQFSSLEQMTNMTKAIDSLITIQQQNQLIAYSDFIGKEVNWSQVDENSNMTTGNGTVQSVKFADGTAHFVLEDGLVLEPGNISEVIAARATNATKSDETV